MSAIDDQQASRFPTGILQCHRPSNRDQILPAYALHRVMMLAKFLRRRGGTSALSAYLHAARVVLCRFLEHQNQPFHPFQEVL